jgi:hypothetical protein
MSPRIKRGYWLSTALGVVIALSYPEAGRAQPQAIGTPDRGDPINLLSRKAGSTEAGSGATKAPEEPYGGQLYCPVTGLKLGLKQEAVKVQTSIGEQKPGFFASLFGQKPTPGVVIYVCCPECAEKVRQNPGPYLSSLITDRGVKSNYTYATAPAQRPVSNSLTPNSLPTTAPNGGQTPQQPVRTIQP